MTRKRPRPSGIFAADEQVFRFFTDGLVLDVLVKPAPVAQNAESIATWLHRDSSAPHNGIYAARYDLSGDTIAFTTRSHFGDSTVEISGRWDPHRLTLDRREAGRPRQSLRFQRIWPQ